MDFEEGLIRGTAKIILQSGKVYWKSRNPLLFILLASLIPYGLLFGAYLYILSDFAIKLQFIDKAHLAASLFNAIKNIIWEEFFFILASSFLSALFSMSVIYAVDMGLKDKEMTFKGLMLKIFETFKGVVVTWFFVLFLNSGYLTFSALFVISIVLAGDQAVWAFILAGVVLTLVALLSIYLSIVFVQGVVISVLHPGCYGLAALGRSSNLIQGRRALGFLTNLSLTIFAVIVGALCSFLMLLLGQNTVGSLLVMVITFVIIVLLQSFCIAVYTVFHHKCSTTPKDDLIMQEQLVYSRVSTSVPLSQDLP